MFSDKTIDLMIEDAKAVWPGNWPTIEKHFNRCCFSAAYDIIINDFGLFQKKGDFETEKTIMEKVKVFEDAVYVFQKMLFILCEEKVIERKDDGYVCIDPNPDIESPAECLVIAVRKLPAEAAPFQWLARGIGGLKSFIAGKAYGEEVMFPWNDFSLVEDVYFSSKVYGFWSNMAGKAVKRIIEDKYDGKVTALEVGAGTGNGTYNVFENTENVNDKFAKYIFTDISRALIKKAKKNDYFKKFDFIDYQVLDFTKDFEAQNIQKSIADIVLAVNVLHATDDLDVGCKALYDLVKEGGYVVLGEIAPPEGSLYRYMELTFGLLASYNKYDDMQNRSECPIVRPDKWIELFKKAGFKDVIAIPGERLENCDRGGVIIAQK